MRRLRRHCGWRTVLLWGSIGFVILFGLMPQDVNSGDLADSLADSIRGGSMPPWFYTLIHTNASLNSTEKAALVRGLEATFAASPPEGGGG